MTKSLKSNAEERFAKATRQDQQFLRDREKASQQMNDKIARLRALRLVKEAGEKEEADRKAAEKAASGKPPAKPKAPVIKANKVEKRNIR